MNPHSILGIPQTASKDEARAAYRKLAQKYHPDKGGNEAKFKEVKAAWELIDRGYQATPATPAKSNEAPYKSSFTDPAGAARRAQATQAEKEFKSAFDEDYKPRAPQRRDKPKPAPGFEGKGTTPILPQTTPVWARGEMHEGEILFEITPRLAKTGCYIPFIHKGERYDYEIRPGSTDSTKVETFYKEGDMIGMFPPPKGVSIKVSLRVREPRPEPNPEEETKDYEVKHEICALGLFSGGKIETKDAHGEKVSLTIDPGYDHRAPLIIEGRGYGARKRGNMIITIVPVFKAPSTFTQNEQKMLDRIIQLATK